MSRKCCSLAVVLFGALQLATPAARGVNHDITVGPGTTYSPQFLTIQAGDTITWTKVGNGIHNVTADNGSFRCANGCDDQGGNGAPSTALWTSTRSFNSAGVIGVHCEIHGSPGNQMFGTITVEGTSNPGSLRFTGANFSVGEATTPVTITVSRTGGTDGPVSVAYATSNVTATAGADYTAASGTLSWANGDGANKTFSVPITNDTTDEPDETVHLALSNPTGGASLGNPSGATLTIVDNDPTASAGTLAFGAPTFSLAESGGSATIPVVRSGGATGAVSVSFATANGTATGGSDYTSANGVLTWANGESGTKNFAVGIVDDTVDEPNETVLLALSSPTGGATLGSPANATLTIQDNDVPAGPGTLALQASTFSGAEGGAATITVARSGGMTGSVSVSYATSDGTATAGADYVAASGTVNFADGQGGTQTFPISLLADDAIEGSESFTVTLSAPTGGATLGSPASATVQIADEDAPGDDLSAAEVTCDAARLSGLLTRTTATPAGASKLTNLNVSFTGTGDFAGIATVGTGPQTVEKALAFSSNPEEITFLRNPVRPQLFSVSVTRNDLNSDLVASNEPEAIRLAINPTLDANPPAGNLLAIDNISGAAGKISDAKPGRGLAPLLAPCHRPFSDRDVHLFHILAKMARAELSGAPRTEIAIYRGAATGSYRLDAFPYNSSGASLGRLSATLDVTFDGAGALNEGTLHILPACTAGQTNDCTNVVGAAALALYKPEASGTASTNFVRLTNGVADFQWNDLLDDTTWKKPLAGAASPALQAATALSPSETACDASRLIGLLGKTTALASRNAKTSNLAVSFTATGDFAGIATSGNGPGTPEAALAFSSNPEETTLLRNPTRPQLFSVSVTRNDLNSDLVAAGNAEELRLNVNPTLDANPPAGNLLSIDNLEGAAGRPADAKPGRGLAPLLAPCHDDFSGPDVHVFRVLEKVLRGEAAGAKSVEIAIYRGEATNTYRIDALPIGADGLGKGRLSALLEVAFTPAGDLAAGTLTILPHCTAGQTSNCTDVTGTAALALFKPAVAGAFPPATTYRVSTAGPASVAIDFADLLAGTSWRRPL